MEAVIQAFINSILGFNKEQLFGLCVQLKRDDYAKEVCIKEYRASDNAMARDYQHALQKIKDLEKEILDLKKALERTSSQKDLLNRYRFGSHNEKIRALHASSGEEIQDPISEDQVPDETPGKGKKEKPAPSKNRMKQMPKKKTGLQGPLHVRRYVQPSGMPVQKKPAQSLTFHASPTRIPTI